MELEDVDVKNDMKEKDKPKLRGKDFDAFKMFSGGEAEWQDWSTDFRCWWTRGRRNWEWRWRR